MSVTFFLLFQILINLFMTYKSIFTLFHKKINDMRTPLISNMTYYIGQDFIASTLRMHRLKVCYRFSIRGGVRPCDTWICINISPVYKRFGWHNEGKGLDMTVSVAVV